MANWTATSSPPLLRGYIDGLTLVPGTTTMQVNPGLTTDSTAASYMSLAAAISKSTASWVAGTGNGGFLDSGSISASAATYHWFVISGSSVDVGFSASLTPTLPTGYTFYRLIMSWLWTGTAWVQGVQEQDEVLYNNVQTGASATMVANVSQLFAVGVPSGVKVQVIFDLVQTSTSTGFTYVSSPDQADEAGSIVNPIRCSVVAVTAQFTGTVGPYRLRTNTSGQLRAICTQADVVKMSALGYVHPRGKNQ